MVASPLLTRPMPSLKMRVAAGAFWATLETWAGQLLQLGIFVVLSRLLGPEAYGLMGVAILVNACADILITGGGWDDALVQRRSLTATHLSSLFWLVLGGSGLLAGLVALGAAPTATLFGAPELAGVMRWLAWQLPLGALAIVPEALLRREMQFAPLFARRLVALAIAGGVAIAMALAGQGVWSLVAFQLVQAAVAAAVLWMAAGWRPSGPPHLAALRELLPFALKSLGDHAVQVGDAFLLRSVVGLVLGPVALGYYTFVQKILELMIQRVSRPVERVLLPSASRLADDPVRYRELVGRAAELIGLVTFPVAGGVALVAADLVPLVFGAAWAPAVPMLQALMLVAAMAPFGQLSASILFASGAAGWQLALTLLGTALLAALLALGGTADLTAIAMALVARAAVDLAVRLAVVGRVTQIDLIAAAARTLRPLAAACLMIAVVTLGRAQMPADLDGLLRLLLSIALGVAAYAAAVLLLARRALDGALAVARLLRR